MIILLFTLFKKEIKSLKTITILLFLNLFLCIAYPENAFSAGINIPAGSTINVNNSTLNVGGDITISGTLQTTTGTITLTGNWDNNDPAGTYSTVSGTVDFNRMSGTQTINSGGTNSKKQFYRLIHSGDGTLQLVTSIVQVNNYFNNSAGTIDANGQDFIINGDWEGDVSARFNDSLGTSTVWFQGVTQNIIGTTNAFNNVSKIDHNTLIFSSTGEQFVRGKLELIGDNNVPGFRLTLTSDNGTDQFKLNLLDGGIQELQYLDVSNGDATGVSLIAKDSAGVGQNNDDLEPAPHWVFGAGEFTWQGDIDSDWSKAGNWDLGMVPRATDTVIIRDVTGVGNSQPTLRDDTTVANLILQTDALMDMNYFALNVTATASLDTGAILNSRDGNLTINTLDNEGTIQAYGPLTQTIDITNPDLDSGTFEFIGDSDGVSESFTIPNLNSTVGAPDYYNLVIDSAGAQDSYQTNSDLVVAGTLETKLGAFTIGTDNEITVDGSLTVDGGTLTATNGNINDNGDVLISSGTFVAPDTSHSFTVAGNFTQNGGTFTHSSGTVTFDGTDQTISANGTTFYGLEKSVTAADTLTFSTSVATTPIITGTLVLQGTSGNILSIQSDSVGVQAPIRLQAGASQTLEYLEVRDSNASGGMLLVARHSTQPNGNNTNWVFDGATITWQGDNSISPTDWDTPLNWDLGIVPMDMDTVVIPNVANDPVLGSAVDIKNLTINTSGIMYLNGNNLTVNSTLSNEGSISAFGSEAITINTLDLDSGTFIYTGDNTSSAFNLAQAPSPNEYYNLIINDANPNVDTLTAARDLVIYNDLTVTEGILVTTNVNLDVNHDFIQSGGIFIAPTNGKSFTVGRNFNRVGSGVFTNSSGTVTFDSTSAATISGNTVFNNIYSNIPGKHFNFAAGSNQTVEGQMNFYGKSSSKMVLRSTVSGSKWDVTFPNGEQGVKFIDVKDSDANTNNVTCYACVGETQNNNEKWIFLNLAIEVPDENRITDTTPTIIGVAIPDQTITIKDKDGNVVATTKSDANGNFRVEVLPADAFTPGPNTLQPFLGTVEGPITTGLTISSAPETYEQPTITSQANGDRINGDQLTVEGKGLAGATVSVLANDFTGNLLLQTVGTGTVNGSGNYSVTLTTPLTSGTNYLSVTVNGTASDIIYLSLTFPFGVVFNTTDNTTVINAVVTLYRASDNQPATVADGDLDPGDVNPVTTGADGFYSFVAADGNYYIDIQSQQYEYPTSRKTFPPGRSVIVGSKGEVFTVAGNVQRMDQPADLSSNIFRIVKDANKKEATVGAVVTYTITIESLISETVNNVSLEDKIPPGFKFIDGRVTLDALPISNPQGTRPLFFALGNFTPGKKKTLKYQLVVGSGVTIGNYNNTAFVKHEIGDIISNKATETVKITLDPLFDLGTVIGKVFFDDNENGIQDAPEYVYMDRETITEKPVPFVKIVMEDGTVITTDKDGKFSVPSLLPGRHLFRLDESSLPEGCYLTTDKAVIVDITEGLLAKVNFGVTKDYERFNKAENDFFTNKVKISHDKKKPEKRLNVALFNDEIATFNGCFVENAEFRIFTNYAALIDHWKLEITDNDTNRMIKSFEGSRFNINDPILWNGKDYKGNYIRLDRNYAYRLYVEDAKNNYDLTKSANLKFRVLKDEEERKQYLDAREERRQKYTNWVASQEKKSNYLKQNIIIDGETISVEQLDSNIKSIRVMKGGKLYAEIPVSEKHGLTARELLEGNNGNTANDENKNIEFILPKGDYDILVQNTESDVSALLPKKERSFENVQKVKSEVGEPVSSYVKQIKIGEDYMFFVGMGDAKVGYNINRGNVEPIQFQDKYRNGFYYEGKMAYYLKGKILGKYLITSSYDSDRDKKELFKTLDPDQYYPVYGDDSSKDYSATDTQGNLYLLVQWDKSSAIWGNYSIGFDDTEFSKFSRTLYGGKVDFESLGTTKYGEPRTKAVVFRASAKQKSAHNEFLATGGSVYFLKNKDIIEGSDKVKIEVRDKITGLVVSERSMVQGADYQMDYSNGRMVFWKPVPMLVDSYSIISSDLLAGNLVYVVTDYEYDVKDEYDEANVGLRLKQAVTDEVVVGTTYVKEDKDSSDYELKGTDVTVHLGKDATVKAEYAESKSEAQGSFVSTDGGLSFSELATGDTVTGRAYGIKGDARLFNRIGITGHYKWIDNNFSTSATSSQQGKELIGMGLVYDLNENARITFRHDIQQVIDDGNAQTQLQVGAVKTATSLLQMVYELRKLKLTGEYRKQVVTDKNDAYVSETNTNEDILALKADYEVNDKLGVSLEQQVSMDDTNSNKTTVGVSLKPNDHLTINAKQAFGGAGAGTDLSVTADMSEKLSITGGYAIAKDEQGQKQLTSSIGADVALNNMIKFHSTLGVTEMPGASKTTSLVLGGSAQMDKDTKIQSDITLAEASNNSSTTVSFGGTSKVDDKTTSQGTISVTDSSLDGKTTSFTFGTTSKINEELELASTKTFGSSLESSTAEDKYTITRVKDGKKLEGSLARKYTNSDEEVSQSNILGLSGDVNDKLAFTGSLERGKVQNLDGTQTDRNAVSLAMGYVDKDEETGSSIKTSTKFEAIFDSGDENKRQYYMYHSLEGKLNDALAVFSKIEMSKTRNLSGGYTEERHNEYMIGTAYRPVMYDYLNFLARYTYLENRSPKSQNDMAQVLEERAHVLSAEGLWDINPKWQLSEKFAYKIADEKVQGFDFTKTHTWLMINRLNYNLDEYWTLGGEFRILAQKEAKDMKHGFLVEASRRLGDYAQVGLGYNFTEFNDDLTALNYTSQGPFVRLTGKFYDRTPEELKRAKDKWIQERIDRWAWTMVEEELSKKNSPIIYKLNEYLFMAKQAYASGRLEEAKQIYKDIVIAGQMMFQEASEYIRGKIQIEKDLKGKQKLADQYIKNGEYEKAKKILEKIMADIEFGVVE